jgi:tRNA A58 N-methylase Trm61
MASDDASEYVLGHSARELERLRRQAELVNPNTRQYLIEAGIAPGMRVLDVGSGAGDVAFLAAELVGPSGQVVGVDRSLNAIERITQEMSANQGVIVGRADIGAWTRLPE